MAQKLTMELKPEDVIVQGDNEYPVVRVTFVTKGSGNLTIIKNGKKQTKLVNAYAVWEVK